MCRVFGSIVRFFNVDTKLSISSITHLERVVTAMQDTVESEKENYFHLQKELEEKKYKYKSAHRPLIWFRNIIITNILIAIIAIVAWGIVGNDAYISGWCETALWIVGIFTVLLIFHFFRHGSNGLDSVSARQPSSPHISGWSSALSQARADSRGRSTSPCSP